MVAVGAILAWRSAPERACSEVPTTPAAGCGSAGRSGGAGGLPRLLVVLRPYQHLGSRGNHSVDRISSPSHSCQHCPVTWHPFDVEIGAGERTVLIARHGRTTANENGIHQNWGPYQLSSSGFADLEVAKGWWRKWKVTHYMSSPVPRAIETAKELWSRIDELDAAWGERAVPAVEGLPLNEAHRLHPALLTTDGWVSPNAPPNQFVESGLAFNARVQAALLRAAGSVPEDEVVAVMTHGAVLAAILAPPISQLGQEPPERLVRFGNLAVLEVAVDPVWGWRVRQQHDPLVAK
jgi:broad specificity phosphatase PhoE